MDGQAERDARTVDQLTTILKTISDGIIVTDGLGTMIYANEAATAILGYPSPESLTAATPVEVFTRFRVFDEDRRPLTPLDLPGALVVAGAPRARRVVRWIDQTTGSESVTILSSARVDDADGRIRYIVNCFTDITARVQTEEQLRQAHKLEAIGALAGGVAHDFNNLLTVIVMCASMIVENPVPAQIAELTSEILLAAERGRGLTSQLLAFGRKQLMQQRVVDLNTVVVDAERLLRRVLGEHIVLSTEMGVELPPVFQDPDQLLQIILNLAVNARDAMTAGGSLRITTAMCAHADVEAPPEIRFEMLSVTDTGCGIDESTQRRMFEPFFTTKPTGKGTGLGLSTVYGIIHQAGGHIRVRSRPGEGATFEVCMPCADAGCAEPGAVANRRRPTPRTLATILLVEDEAALARLVSRALEQVGYTVLVAGSPDEALALVGRDKAPKIDLLLSDVVMPGRSGPALAAELEQIMPGIPVLYMSGYLPDSIQETGGLPAEAAFIAKPFTMDELLERLTRLLR